MPGGAAPCVHRGARTLGLWVTDSNTPAIRLYTLAGFVRTGRSEPLPSNPSLSESFMLRALRLDADDEQSARCT